MHIKKAWWKQEEKSQHWDQTGVPMLWLGFKGNETEISAWDSVMYSAAGTPSMMML